MYRPLTCDFPDIIDDKDDAGFCYIANILEHADGDGRFGAPDESRADGMIYASWRLMDAYYRGGDMRKEARSHLAKDAKRYLHARHNDEFCRGHYDVIDKFLTL